MDTQATRRKVTFRSGYTKTITFSPDNCHLMTAGSPSRYVRQWKVDDGGEVHSFDMESPGGHTINAIAASMDGRWIVIGDSGNQLVVWDAVTRLMVRQISEHTDQICAVDVSSDSTRIASGSVDSTVRIFNIISGIRLVPLMALGNSVVPTDVKFSSDGCQVAITAHSLVCIYDAHSGNKLLEFPVPNTLPSSLAWSFDGQQLFVSSPGKITRFDTSTSSRFKSQWLVVDVNNDYTASVVTHGRFIACVTGHWVSFWDYTLGKQIGSILDHSTAVNCIAISPDGEYLACGHQQSITVYHLGRILPRHYLWIPRVSRVPVIPLLQVDDPVLEPWRLGNLVDALSISSKEIQNAQDSDPSYHAHTLAARSIIRARLRKWTTAIEDAEMVTFPSASMFMNIHDSLMRKSLQIKKTPVGHIARSMSLIGADKQEVAINDFDLAFRDCDLNDNMLLLAIKSILVFMCGKHKEAASRLHGLLTAVDEKTKGPYIQVLGNMYLKQGDYENAVQTLALAKKPYTSQETSLLMSITLIFGWDFDRLEDIAYQRLCESLYPTGRIKEVGGTLLKMVGELTEDEKEPAHGRILEELVTHSGQVTLLMWTGKSSSCNSCLPSSPEVYSRQQFVPPPFEPAELERRTHELRATLPQLDAMVIFAQATRFQPVRFAHFRLLLPCIVYNIKSLRKRRGTVYYAETAEFGVVEFRTVDSLPFEEPQRLVFADLRIHGLKLGSDTQWNSSDMANSVADANAELVHAPMIEEVPSGEPQLDTYTRALQLIARLRQPFSALLLFRQSDGSYKRVAADNEIVVRGTGNNVPKDIRVEVLEIL